jgi:hypothetical protein
VGFLVFRAKFGYGRCSVADRAWERGERNRGALELRLDKAIVSV